MATQAVNNVKYLYVSDASAKSTDDIGSVGASKIKIMAPGGGDANLTSAEYFQIVQGRDGATPLVSKTIKKSNIESAKLVKGAMPVEQITYVGFNGTAGKIDVINDNLYFLRIYMQELITSASDGRVVKEAVFKSGSTTSQAQIAYFLTKSGIANFDPKLKHEPEQKIKFERVNSGDLTALGTSVDDVVFTKGSVTISADDIDDATGSNALAVGNLLVVGTDNTGPVYEIVSIDTANDTAELDIPYQGETTTIADTGLRQIEVADIGDFGIKMTGLPLDYSRGRIRFNQVRFEVAPQDFGDTIVTDAQGTSPGVNYGKVLADIEEFTRSEDGEQYRVSPYPVLFGKDAYVKTDKTYSVYNIRVVDSQPMGISTKEESRIDYYVAIEEATVGTTPTGTLKTELDKLV